MKKISELPPPPPIFLGEVYKKGKLLPHYNLRYIEINPLKGIYKRFSKKEDYPSKELENISLKEFISSKITTESSGKYFYLEINFNTIHLYRFESKESCNKWNNAINECVKYFKLCANLLNNHKDANNYFNSIKTDIIEIDVNNGKTTTIKSKNENNNKDRKIQSSTNLRKRNPYANIENDSKLFQDPILNNSKIGFDSFVIEECLGAGSFGKVFKVKLKTSGETYAMKVLNKRALLKNNHIKYAITECNVLKQANSPFLLSLHFSFQPPENLYMVIDYCPGGDLNYHLLQGLFEEEAAKFYIAELILGIEHLHKLNIIYRDLKPENILIYKDNHIKLADFGLAKEGINDIQFTKSFVGSPAYLSPEMLSRRGVGKSADIYGIGAVLYEMLCGVPPFFSNDIKELYKKIWDNKLELNNNNFSESLKDLLCQLLCKDPLKRIGITDKAELKDHEWFKGIDWDKLSKKQINPPLDLVDIKMKSDHHNIDKIPINFEDKDYTQNDKDKKRVPKFSFIKGNGK